MPKTLTEPNMYEVSDPSVAVSFNLRNRGIQVVAISLEKPRDAVIARIPSAAELDLIAVDPPAEWLADKGWR
jgi:hypothetical protein